MPPRSETVAADIAGHGTRSANSGRVRILAICFLAWTLTNVDQSLFGYTIPSLMREFSLTLDQIGLILSGCFIFAIFSTILVGLSADRFGRRIALCSCLFISALAVDRRGWLAASSHCSWPARSVSASATASRPSPPPMSRRHRLPAGGVC
jgi:MFS family permease